MKKLPLALLRNNFNTYNDTPTLFNSVTNQLYQYIAHDESAGTLTLMTSQHTPITIGIEYYENFVVVMDHYIDFLKIMLKNV